MTIPAYGEDEVEVFRPRTAKWALVLLLCILMCIAFAAGERFIIVPLGSPWNRVAGLAFAGFFALGSIAALTQFVPNSSFLRVAPEGLTVCSMWRTKFYRWSDIERFGVADFSTGHFGVRQHHRMVGFNFSSSYAGRGRAEALRSVNRSLTGFEASLPDNYGKDCAQLAAHLNRLREKHLAGSDST